MPLLSLVRETPMWSFDLTQSVHPDTISAFLSIKHPLWVTSQSQIKYAFQSSRICIYKIKLSVIILEICFAAFLKIISSVMLAIHHRRKTLNIFVRKNRVISTMNMDEVIHMRILFPMQYLIYCPFQILWISHGQIHPIQFGFFL